MIEFNPFNVALAQLDEAMELLELDTSTREVLRTPMMEVTVSVPIRLDNGKVKTFRGYRVQYNTARGPAKGGLRWHPEETLDTVRALAAWMTWKTALLDLPLGGGKGGITCNPKELSEGEKERLARAYIRKLHLVLGDTQDVPAPDVYTTPQIMAWMMDEYESIIGSHQPGMITGKPVALGGSQGRNDATARGGIYTVREAAKYLKISLNQSAYAIQGFGNAGQNAALLHPEILGGGLLLAVSDSSGGVLCESGIDPKALMKHKHVTGSVKGFPGTRPVSNEELLELKVDVLYPAALENAITERNAPNIKARIVCELANGPVTPEADQIMFKNGVFVIPDFLANAGGVTVSYFEQVQNAANYYWTLEEVYQRLDQKMSTAFAAVLQYQRRYEVHPRLAAYLLAVERVVEACRLRSWV